jgi:hypothetical protein
MMHLISFFPDFVMHVRTTVFQTSEPLEELINQNLLLMNNGLGCMFKLIRFERLKGMHIIIISIGYNSNQDFNFH